MDDILELSRNHFPPSPGHTTTSKAYLERPADEPSYLSKPHLQARLGALAQEISSIEASIADLQKIKAELLREQNIVKKELNEIDSNRGGAIHKDSTNGQGKEVVIRRGSQINYMDEFEWSGPLKVTMKSVFGIDNFRLCQEG
jgi:ATP-dependent DNA helicase Q1